jgi:hypothetical protein
MLILQVFGNQSFYAQFERLGGCVAEDVSGSRIPEDYPLGLCVRDYDRVPNPLEELPCA